MAQSNFGIYALVANSWIYSTFQSLIARPDALQRLAQAYIQAKAGDRVVDFGCGPGSILQHLGPVDYIGIDPEPSYLTSARARFGANARFIQARAGEVANELTQPADIVLALALLHHLDDVEARAVFAAARRILKPGGRMVTIDCAWTSPQHPLARLLIGLDRGKSVRAPEGYLRLAQEHFPRVESELRTDLLRVPYTHFIMTCRA